MNVRTIVNEQAGSIPEITSIVHGLPQPLIHDPRQSRNLYGASVRMKELLNEFLNSVQTKGRWRRAFRSP